MAGDTANPRLFTNADVYVGAIGSTAPTDLTAAWAATWKPLGLLSEDGMTESRDQDETDHYSWGGILVRTTRSKHKRTLKVAALENNLNVFGLVNPGSTAVTATGVTTRTIKVPTPDPRAFGFEMLDGLVKYRRVVPRGEVVAVGDVVYCDGEMTAYELTINIYPSSTGVLYVELTDDLQAVTP